MKTLCAKWLEDNFKIVSRIERVKVLPQKEIDKALGLVVVEFKFTFGDTEGNAGAFFDTDEVARASQKSEDVFREIDIEYWRENSAKMEEEIKQCL